MAINLARINMDVAEPDIHTRMLVMERVQA
jgi:hypothetical protein